MTRVKRTKEYNLTIGKEWSDYYWTFIFENERKINFRCLSINPNLTWDIVINNFDKKWNLGYYGVFSNPNITWDIVKNNFPKGLNYNILNILKLYYKDQISWSDIENNLDVKWDWDYLSEHLNYDIILKNKNFPWTSFSKNNSINIDIVKSNPDILFNFTYLSENENFTWDIIKSNIKLPWNWIILSDKLSSEIIKDNLDCPWDWKILSYKMPWEVIENNLDKPWKWDCVSLSSHINWHIIDKCFKKTHYWYKFNTGWEKWDLSCIYRNTNIVSSFFELSKESIKFFIDLMVNDTNGLCWASYAYSKNEKLTWEIIKYCPSYYWDWYSISENKCITWELYLENQRNDWEWIGLTTNPNITWDIIKNNMDKPWRWNIITRNPNITWDIIKNNLDYPWNWESITKDLNITVDIIKKHIDKPWSWEILSSNENITIKFIKENLDKPFKWDQLSKLTFEKEKNVFLTKKYREYLAAYKIQQWWKHITMSPHYAIGRKFINKKYDNLFDL